MKRIFFLLTLQFCILKLSAQVIDWQSTQGLQYSNDFTSLILTNDGGCLLGGWTDTKISGFNDYDYYIVKLDSLGSTEWSSLVGGNGYDFLETIIPTMDGGYLLGGGSYSDSSRQKTQNSRGYFDFWIVKLDALGNIQWDKTIGGDDDDRIVDIVQTSDMGFVCVGFTASDISGDKTTPLIGDFDYWVVKTDSVGNIQWQYGHGTSNFDNPSKVKIDAMGNIIIGGSRKKFSTSYDYSLLALDSAGNLLWEKIFGGSSFDILSDFKLTSDGGYLCTGNSQSGISGDKTEISRGNYDYWIIKLDSLRQIEWQKTIGGNQADFSYSVVQTFDKGYIVSGYSESEVSGDKTEFNSGPTFLNNVSDFWLVKIDSIGNVLWQDCIGGFSYEDKGILISDSKGGFILGGNSNSSISGDKTTFQTSITKFWIFRYLIKTNKINGSVFLDSNGNGLKDLGENDANHIKVKESKRNGFAFTNIDGEFRILLADSGNINITPLQTNSYYTINPVSQTAIFSGFNMEDTLPAFAMFQAGVFDDLCMTITPLSAFRPGFNGSYMLNYENVGTTTQSPRIVFRIFPNVSFVSSSLTPSAIYPDSVVWNLSSLSPFQTGQILVTVNLSPTIPIGTLLNSYAQIFPIVNDVNPSCNNATWEVTVTGSLDPNDISVDEDTLYSNVFPNPPYLDYLIRFQNTGTDTAFTVKILNPLDTMKLDLNSLEFVAASHPMEMRFIYHERNMEFLFNNILLPDSNVNEPASHGFVRYKVKPKSNLQVGDSIQNFAAIYFDFNEPVITNSAKTHILLFTGLAEQISTSELFVYPNPSSQEINIHVSNTQGKRISLDVYNLFGQKVKSLFDGKIMSSELKQRFDISSLNQGVYLLQYNVDGVTKSKKIIKW